MSSKHVHLSTRLSQRTLRIINDSENDFDEDEDDEEDDNNNKKKKRSSTKNKKKKKDKNDNDVNTENNGEYMMKLDSSPLSKSSIWVGGNETGSSMSGISANPKRLSHKQSGYGFHNHHHANAMPAHINVSVLESRIKTSSSSTSGYTKKSEEHIPPPHSSPLFSPVEDLSSDSHRRRRQLKKERELLHEEDTSSMSEETEEKKKRRGIKERFREAVTELHLWQAFSVLVLVLTVIPVLLATLTMIMTSNTKIQNRLISSYSNITAGYAMMLDEHFSNAESLARVRSQTTSIFSLLSGDMTKVARADYETLSRYSIFSEMYIITRDNSYFRVFMVGSQYYIWVTFPNGTLCQNRVENPTTTTTFVEEWCTHNDWFLDSPLYLAVDNTTSGDARWTGKVYTRPGTFCHSTSIFSEDNFSHVFGACLYNDGAEDVLSGGTENEAIFVVDAPRETVVGASKVITAHRVGVSTDEVLPVSKVDDFRVKLVDNIVRERYGTWSALANALYSRHTKRSKMSSQNITEDVVLSYKKNTPYVLSMNVGNSTIVSFVLVSRKGFTFVMSVVHFYGEASVSDLVVGTIVLVTVVCGGCMGIFIYCVVRPLKTLSADMVATTDLKFVTHTKDSEQKFGNRSVLREMHDMKKSFELLAVCTEALTKYISPEIALDVMRGNAIKPQKPSIAIMFVSLCNFLPLLSSLPYKTLMIVLKTWFRHFGRAINARGGTIDKYIDGCIMAIFGAPKPLQNNEDAACNAALHFYSAMQEVEKEIEPYFPNRLYYSVGIHCGPTFVGHMGYSERKCYTVIGNNANVASRVEKLTAIYGVSPLITGAIEKTVKSKYLCVFLDVIYLRGHKTLRTKIYHLLGFVTKKNKEIEMMIVDRFNEIHEKIRNGNKDIALELIDRSLMDENLDKYKRALEVLKKHVLSNTMTKNIYDSNTEDSDRSSSELINV